MIIERVDVKQFEKPFQLDDASWVGFRLAEVLPLDMRVKQELLEMTEAAPRLSRIRALLMEEGLARPTRSGYARNASVLQLDGLPSAFSSPKYPGNSAA